MTLSEYLSGFRGREVAVLGLGVSNAPLARLLMQAGARLCVHDKKKAGELGPLEEELRTAGVQMKLGEDYLESIRAETVFRSPGIRPDLPALQKVRAQGGTVTSEMQAFFELCPCPVFGVTGSDGKTTTTTLIARMLTEAGHTCHLGGNIGTPLLGKVPEMKPGDFAAVELSSFQLMDMTRSPSVAAVTNLSPNHLDIHTDMDEYIRAKKNIFLHQRPGDKLVLNYNNDITRSFASLARGTVVPFSWNAENGGVYCKDGMIYACGEPVLRAEEIRLPGRHNVENMMTAIAATLGFVEPGHAAAVARSFGGVEHRLEFVREVRGVKWYNGSIDSSPTRTAAALGAFSQRVIVILGGYDKHIPYGPLGLPLCRRAKHIVLTGDTAPAIRAAVEACGEYDPIALPMEDASGFENAVARAHAAAKPGDIVLLSPASASFDRFASFEQRGQYFKELVAALD